MAVTTTGTGPGLTDLVDPLFGIVRAVTDVPRHPDLPAGYHCRIASVADTRRFADWLSDRIAAGTAFDDPDQAFAAAVGEAVERYCGNNIPGGLLRESTHRMVGSGRRVTTLADLPTFSTEQHAQPDFRYRRIQADEPIRWVPGIDDRGERHWVPGSWVYLNWHQGRRRDDPRTNHLHYAGIATGVGVQDAVDRALTECLERDAMVGWWTLGLPATPLDPHSLPGLAERWKGCPLQLRLVQLPGGFGVPVIGALIRDEERRIPAAGFSAAADPVRAAWKAIQEALQVWVADLGLLEADGVSHRAVRSGIFAPGVYLPFREDRHYLDDVGENFSRIKDLAAQTQLWLDDRLHPMLDRFDGVGPPRPIGEIAPGDLGTARGRLAEAGHRVITVDLTTTDVAETGLAVVRVLVPGLLVNSPAAYPYLGTPRLAELARLHGRPAPSLRTVTLTPPPHN